MTAYYPNAIKDFVTYQDQPGPDDKTIIYAKITNEIHDEVIAIEKVIGPRPFMCPSQTTMGGSVQWLKANKADWPHNHGHSHLVHLDADDHSDYVRTDGSRGFTRPVASPTAWFDNQLIQLVEARESGINASQFEYLLAVLMGQQGAHVSGSGGTPWLWGAPAPNTAWKICGGRTSGYTDYNGNIYVDFNGAFNSMVLTFVYMRMPVPGRSHFGYTYNYLEDQLLLGGISNRGAVVFWTEDTAVDRSAWVSMCWIAIGW